MPLLISGGTLVCSTSVALGREQDKTASPHQQEQTLVRQIAFVTLTPTFGSVDGTSTLGADQRAPGLVRHQNQFDFHVATKGIAGTLGYRLQFSKVALGLALAATWERSEEFDIFSGNLNATRAARERLSALNTSLGFQFLWKSVAIHLGAGFQTLSVLSSDPDARFESDLYPSLSAGLQFYIFRGEWLRLPTGLQFTRRFETLDQNGNGIKSDWFRAYLGVELDIPMD